MQIHYTITAIVYKVSFGARKNPSFGRAFVFHGQYISDNTYHYIYSIYQMQSGPLYYSWKCVSSENIQRMLYRSF